MHDTSIYAHLVATDLKLGGILFVQLATNS